jgi:hypothetical protein
LERGEVQHQGPAFLLPGGGLGFLVAGDLSFLVAGDLGFLPGGDLRRLEGAEKPESGGRDAEAMEDARRRRAGLRRVGSRLRVEQGDDVFEGGGGGSGDELDGWAWGGGGPGSAFLHPGRPHWGEAASERERKGTEQWNFFGSFLCLCVFIGFALPALLVVLRGGFYGHSSPWELSKTVPHSKKKLIYYQIKKM